MVINYFPSKGLAWWYWLGIWGCAPPQGLRFNSPRSQFGSANLTSSKKKKIISLISIFFPPLYVTKYFPSLSSIKTAPPSHVLFEPNKILIKTCLQDFPQITHFLQKPITKPYSTKWGRLHGTNAAIMFYHIS